MAEIPPPRFSVPGPPDFMVAVTDMFKQLTARTDKNQKSMKDQMIAMETWLTTSTHDNHAPPDLEACPAQSTANCRDIMLLTGGSRQRCTKGPNSPANFEEYLRTYFTGDQPLHYRDAGDSHKVKLELNQLGVKVLP
ncbi:hypothetical protein NE237_015272 [Protea cynaroides]|uniref:Uncharacterized protein n=1 Tax=Protea cynaroides TaxID=273540 RepID=A0A9Q0KDY2_9MAGN|nr:hypothetical protein NE237_015272 [Protea cynaroides]